MVSFASRALSANCAVGIRALVVSLLGAGVFLGSAAQAFGGTIVRFDTNLGSFDVELFDDIAPATVANFLNYVTGGRYADTLVHRSASSPPSPFGLIQGGVFDLDFDPIATDPPIPLEYQVPNARGTMGMGRTIVPDSATSSWYINTTDNSDLFGPPNNGGFAIFGQVLGNGMDVVDAINALPRFGAGPLPQDVPLRDFTPGVDDPLDHTVVVNNVTVVPEPSTSVLAFTGIVLAAVLLRHRRERSVSA